MRLKNLTIRLEKLNTPPPLRTIILHHVKNYYNNNLLPDLQNTNTNLILDECMNKQTSIGWEHFTRGRLISSFHPVINRYYRSNKLSRRFKSSTWYRNMIRFMWQLHHKAWLEYCDTIHAPPKLSTVPSPVQITLLALVQKYKIEANIPPTHKEIFFDCTMLQCQK